MIEVTQAEIDQERAREVETKILNECPVHPTRYIYQGVCDDCKFDWNVKIGNACKEHREIFVNGICSHCQRREMRQSVEGVSWGTHNRVDKKIKKVAEIDSRLTLPFIEARNRKTITTMTDDEAKKAVCLIVDNYRKPHLNTRQDQSGNAYHHRKVFWGVNIESGVGLSFILNHAGITNFKITPDRWLTIWINRDLTIREILKLKK